MEVGYTARTHISEHIQTPRDRLVPYPAPPDAWQEYCLRLPEKLDSQDPKIPNYLETREVDDGESYVPSTRLLDRLRAWLISEGQTSLYYFMTEHTGTEKQLDFLVPSSRLSRDLLLELNPGAESVLTGYDFSWAVFVDHEGRVVVGGPQNLASSLI